MNETGLKAAGIRWRQAKEARDDEHQQCANVASAAHLAGITYVEMIPARAERARVAYWRSKHRAGTVDNAATLEEFRSAHRRALAAEANEQSARLAMHQTWESAHGVARGLIAALAGVDRGYVNAILGPSATAPHVDVTERDRILATVTSTSSAASEANLAYREAVRVRGHAFADRIKAGERGGDWEVARNPATNGWFRVREVGADAGPGPSPGLGSPSASCEHPRLSQNGLRGTLESVTERRREAPTKNGRGGSMPHTPDHREHFALCQTARSSSPGGCR